MTSSSQRMSERRQWEDELQQVRDKHAQELQDAQRTRLELESRLGQVEAARESLLGEKQSLCKELSDGAEATLALKVDMGQNAEKLYAVEERCKGIEKERDDLKRRCKEFEARLDVLNRSERAAEKDASEKLGQLEKALEEALEDASARWGAVVAIHGEKDLGELLAPLSRRGFRRVFATTVPGTGVHHAATAVAQAAGALGLETEVHDLPEAALGSALEWAEGAGPDARGASWERGQVEQRGHG